MVHFNTENAAKKHFKDVDVEQCEICKCWTASLADHDDGEINGGICNDDGTEHIYDRVCERCQEEYEEQTT